MRIAVVLIIMLMGNTISAMEIEANASIEAEIVVSCSLNDDAWIAIIKQHIAKEKNIKKQVQLLIQWRETNKYFSQLLGPSVIGDVLRFCYPPSALGWLRHRLKSLREEIPLYSAQPVDLMMEEEELFIREKELVAQEELIVQQENPDAQQENFFAQDSSDEELFSEDDPADKKLNPLNLLDTLFFNAISGGSSLWAAGLLSAKSYEGVQDFDDGFTGLHTAVLVGSTSCIHVLLQAGAYIDALDENGCTPLHHAAAKGKLNCIRLLLTCGAQTEVIDEEDEAPLDKAVASKKLRCVRELIAAGAHIDRLDEQGATLIHRVAAHGSVDILNELLVRNPDLTIIDDEDNTALHYAAMEGRHANIESLLAGGAHRHARNIAGDTPYDIAQAYGHTKCARSLRSKRFKSE